MKILWFLLLANQKILAIETIVKFCKPNPDNYPLHHAAATSNLDDIEYLVRSGDYQVDESDQLGRTPLHYAALHGRIHSMYALINLGAETHVKDNEHVYPMTLALFNGHYDIYQRLSYYDELTQARRFYGSSPIAEEE